MWGSPESYVSACVTIYAIGIWRATHFSLYLVRREEHIHEMESLLVRIANPKGNRVVPKGKSRGALMKGLHRLIRQRQSEELAELLGSKPRGKRSRRSGKSRHPVTLVGLVSKRTKLYKQYKGREYFATLTHKGVIRFKGKRYTSPSGAAGAVLKSRR